MNLSAIIITKNAEKTIVRALQSVAFADEIIVVDAKSDDQTAAIACAFGAKVVTNAWSGYGQQKNLGRDIASSEWLLFVDADEELTPTLIRSINKVVSGQGVNANCSFYWLQVVTTFLNKPLNHLSGHNLRLFRKSYGRWTNASVHEQVIKTIPRNETTIKLGDDSSLILAGTLVHHSHQNISSYLRRMHRYTTLDANEMWKRKMHRSGRIIKPFQFLPQYLALRQFLKLYIYRSGWLDGLAGWLWCILSSYYEYEMGRKFLILARQNSGV